MYFYSVSDNGVQLVGRTAAFYEVEPQRGDLYAVLAGRRTYLVQIHDAAPDYTKGCEGIFWVERSSGYVAHSVSFTPRSKMIRCHYFRQEPSEN